jgi:hypothetical protein
MDRLRENGRTSSSPPTPYLAVSFLHALPCVAALCSSAIPRLRRRRPPPDVCSLFADEAAAERLRRGEARARQGRAAPVRRGASAAAGEGEQLQHGEERRCVAERAGSRELRRGSRGGAASDGARAAGLLRRGSRGCVAERRGARGWAAAARLARLRAGRWDGDRDARAAGGGDARAAWACGGAGSASLAGLWDNGRPATYQSKGNGWASKPQKEEDEACLTGEWSPQLTR